MSIGRRPTVWGTTGLEVYPVPEEMARRLQLPGDSGLLVVGVEPGGPADGLGLQRRDILLALGRYHVSSLDDLGQLLDGIDAGEEVAIAVLRVDRWGKVTLSHPEPRLPEAPRRFRLG